MKILITGHQGFIGKNLINELFEYELSGYDWNIEKLPDVKGYDWVIHLGAISSTTETDVDKIMLQNYEFSKWLYNECRINNVNLQYASSASVYGLNKVFREDSPKNPKSPYAWSKYLFDRWISQQKHDIIVQGFRYFNVYGKNEEHKGDQASPYSKFIQQAKETGVIQIFEKSEDYKRDFICVEDVCKVHKNFLKIPQSGVWNVGTGSTKSFADIANFVAKKYNAKIEYITIPNNIKEQYQTYTCADITALNSLIKINWIDIEDYINE